MKSKDSKRYRVLVAVCDELFGRAMLNFIDNHTWPAKTEFHLSYVIEPNPLKNPLIIPQEVVEMIDRDEMESGRLVLEYMARNIYKRKPGARVRRHFLVGHAKHELLKLCSDLNADLVIMGSHARSGIDRLLLGSVANAVVSHVPCSSVIVRLSKKELTEPAFDFTLADIPERMMEDLEICAEKASSAK